MKYQAEMLAQVLRLAQVKAQELVQAVPQGLPQLEHRAQLLQESVLQVQRQALALQQLMALPQVQEKVSPQRLLPLQKQALQEALQRAKLQAQAQALAEAEAQVEVLEPREQELVQVPLLEEEWVGWVQTEKE